jgi:aldehyde dehydrogenase (NAD+)
MNVRPDPQLFFDPSKCFIGGRWVAPANGDYLPVENPSDGTTFGQIPRGQKADVDAAVAAARAACKGVWGKTPAAERGRILSRIGMKVLERVEELARIEALDVGKPLKQARADAIALARYMEFYGGACDKIMGETIPFLDG